MKTTILNYQSTPDTNGDNKAERLPKEGLHVKQLNYDEHMIRVLIIKKPDDSRHKKDLL